MPQERVYQRLYLVDHRSIVIRVETHHSPHGLAPTVIGISVLRSDLINDFSVHQCVASVELAPHGVMNMRWNLSMADKEENPDQIRLDVVCSMIFVVHDLPVSGK